MDRGRFVKLLARYLEGDERYAESCLTEFLKSERIEFGDSRYDWTKVGAVDIAKMFEDA